MLARIRQLMQPLRKTVFHPQWLGTSHDDLLGLLEKLPQQGRVLDIGCADSWPRRHLSQSVEYIGLDHPSTADNWYGTRPDIYGDASSLPIADGSIDAVVCLDVLEHLEDPERAMAEIHRVLRDGGLAVMNTPFLYPLHDEPRDFHRWTRHGHRKMGERHGFAVESIEELGSPTRTSFLLLNIALSKLCINGLRKRRAGALLLPFLPFLVIFNNLVAWFLGFVEPQEGMMPIAYRVVFRKP
ncbi:MAG: methyltransferase domain-containing protein [Gammaproteobacteria bacterium]|nr:methyltransferase domain-containing protein [Gammaproteobacteria bacterium]